MLSRRQFCQTALSATALLLSGCLPDGARKSRLHVYHPQSGQAFPVQIRHALGTTAIVRQPQRIIILGVETVDIAYELGVIPLAIESSFWGGDKDGYLEWYRQAVEQSGQKLPEFINMYPEPDVEKLITLRPDVILAPQSGIDAPLYRQLSAIAPVVAYPDRPWLTTIDEIITLTAAALGKPAEAAALRQKIAGHQARIKQKYPQFQRYNFAYIYGNARQSALSVYREGDTRVDAFTDMGFRLAPFVQQLPMRPGSFTSTLGMENADRLNDVDLLITWFNTEQERDQTLNHPIFAGIPAVKRGSYIAFTDKALATAMYQGTPLALNWGLQRFLPMLLDALAKVGR
ncbi:iron-siderophore ABC transporter substrate-binding protein [Neisseria chenwenguii]|uniref:Iron-siderophore ABC transporter substrate-binding protein n=1 Tax=Neisseria chenwenguii TaxID=1853278 RepID=A0A220S3L9_9NEIS|nr:iron-siderophore ABC transporter substrate-binding protein [Neisseria chenwenguii]ASK28091.1 iron-siderophore ABC transporter substrate-binding protein [Neisseria chenwenguii]ROV57242.1 iron-siderophore ABC transporter substrate-binding protein [Neisseria chenwenguii]